jgi:hypothetical protein
VCYCVYCTIVVIVSGIAKSLWRQVRDDIERSGTIFVQEAWKNVYLVADAETPTAFIIKFTTKHVH